jgi:hypothetical protein
MSAARRASWIDKLPPLRLTRPEFEGLLEYSATLPTGTTTGKRWRRLDGAHDHAFKLLGGKPRWVIGEYGAVSKDGKKIDIHWYRPIITVRAE